MPASDFELLLYMTRVALPAILEWSSSVAVHSIRFAIALMILPVTAEGVLNNMSRMGIAALLALYVAMGRPADELQSLSQGLLLFVLIKEMVLGVLLGFAMSTVFWVVEFAGALIDNAAGYNSVQVQNPMSGEQCTPISDLLAKLVGALFFSIGGAVFFTQTLFDSFQVWPVLSVTPSAQGVYGVFIERQLGTLFANTLKLAVPLLLILVLVDVGIGLLSRSAEKLEPTSLAQPVKGVLAILIVIVMVSSMFEPLRQHLVPRGVVKQILSEKP